MIERIEFHSQGTTLRGDLYKARTNRGSNPAIVMAHGFTTTIKGMTADKYAEEFQNSGFSVLLYDHPNFGISDGEPRQEINFWLQARAYIDAIDYLSGRSEIDASKIAIWGASLSARESFLVGTIDERVAAIINIIPAYGDEYPSEDLNGKNYSFAVNTLTADISSVPVTRTETVPVVSLDQINAPSALTDLSAYDWFIEYGERPNTNWINQVSFSVIETQENFHVGQFANKLKAPILMVVARNDEMSGASPEVSKKVFEMIDQPKKMVDIGGDHFGLLYYPSDLFDQSSKAQIEFLTNLFN